MANATTLPAEVEATVGRLLRLPPDQRLAVGRRLVDSVAQEEIDQAWSKEIAERIRQIESGEVQGIPADEVFREVEEQLGEEL